MSASAYNPAMSTRHNGLQHEAYYDRLDWLKVTSRIVIDETTGCWNYQRKSSRAGYGCLSTSNFGSIREQYVHRIMYRFLKGDIPDGMHIDHLCRNRICANPMHLEVVTCAVNVLRGEGPCAMNARKTHCSKGHPLDGHNLILKKRAGGKPYRMCRKCIYARNKAYYLAKDVAARKRARYRKRKEQLAGPNA